MILTSNPIPIQDTIMWMEFTKNNEFVPWYYNSYYIIIILIYVLTPVCPMILDEINYM